VVADGTSFVAAVVGGVEGRWETWLMGMKAGVAGLSGVAGGARARIISHGMSFFPSSDMTSGTDFLPSGCETCTKSDGRRISVKS
jgi:hypothetical protein